MLALTAWSLAGCYSYVPITDPTPSAVTGRVRVLLVARGTLAFRGSLGENVRAIEGPRVRATSESLYLNADQTTSLVRVQIAMLGTPVTVARADVLSVAEQRHSRRWSILTAAALVTGVAILISAITLSSSGAPDDGQASSRDAHSALTSSIGIPSGAGRNRAVRREAQEPPTDNRAPKSLGNLLGLRGVAR